MTPPREAPAGGKHTPGPWTAQRQDIVTRTGMLVATAWSMRGVDLTGRTMDPYATDPDRINATMADANARLIAAAPAMRAALEEIEAAAEGYEDGAPDASAVSKLANEVCRLARAALAAGGGDDA